MFKLKKLVSVLLAFGVLSAPLTAVCAAERVSFSSELQELEGLLADCEKRNIATDYERVNYETIKLFEDYINTDISEGREEEMISYNLSCMQSLYNEARDNLTAYLDGSKTPYTINRPNMLNLRTEGSVLYDGDTPVISVGFGHGRQANENTANFQKFGVNNVMPEIGPTTYDSEIGKLKNTLAAAEKANISVSVLVSPHYFPENLDADLYAETSEFIKYNIGDERAKAVIEEFLRKLLPEIKDYSSLTSICLSNEPTFLTTNFPDFYAPKFREYLKGIYGNILSLNLSWGTTYLSFDAINLPENTETNTPMCYDWNRFNRKTFAEWHAWMADIIEEYLPKTPLHSKLLNRMNDVRTGYNLRHFDSKGTDVEMFDEFSDWAGCDSHDYIGDEQGYWATMFYYDYLHSVTGKPIYNSEDHIIADRNDVFGETQRKHWRNHLWMSAAHGMNMSTIWQWKRSTKDNTDYNGVLFRPDIVSETGKTSLDLIRLSDKMTRIQQKKSDVALLYSKATVQYYENNKAYYGNLMTAYKALLEMGIKPGIVTEDSAAKLEGYKVLIIPGATHATEKMRTAVNAFAENGGTVIYTGDALSKTEYNKSVGNSAVKSYGLAYSGTDTATVRAEVEEYLDDLGLLPLVLVDEDTGKPAKNTDWSYVFENGELLINATNLEYGTKKKFSVYFNGKMVTGFTNLITSEEGLTVVTADEQTPVLLEAMLGSCEVQNLRVDYSENKIRWDYDGAYGKAEVYKVNNDGSLTKLATVGTTEYAFDGAATYIVKGVNSGKKGEIISTDGTGLTYFVEKLSRSERAVDGTAVYKNTLNRYLTVEIELSALNSASEEIGSVSYKLTLMPGKTDSFGFSFPTSERAESVKMTVSYGDTASANKTVYSFE